MTQNYVPNIGNLCLPNAFRDAVHIAVTPAKAGMCLNPGERVYIRQSDNTCIVPYNKNDAIGIVDPFLTEQVITGQTFWLFMFPNTVSNLRHVWQHEAFKVKVPERSE